MSEHLHSFHLGTYTFYFYNWTEFLFLYIEIFILGEYSIRLSKPNPIIFDCGSHIGLATLYYKQHYPDATIYAFEPFEQNIQALTTNIQNNHLTNTHLIKAALSDKEGYAQFFARDSKSRSWGNRLNPTTMRNALTHVSTVKTVKLSQHLTSYVDLLKIDIEGEELLVLQVSSPPFMKTIVWII